MNKVAALVGLTGGTFLLAYWGGEVPAWLRCLECLLVMVGALLFGFTQFNPSAPEWIKHDSVRGVALVYLGVGAVFVPTSLLLSALLIGLGIRLVMKSAVNVTAKIVNISLGQRDGDIVVREEGGITRK